MTTRRAGRLADPRPNAPLLIRIVRWPYAQDCFRGQRVKLLETSETIVRGLQRLAPLMREGQEFRGQLIFGSPIRAFSTRPERLAPIPTVDAWLAESRRTT